MLKQNENLYHKASMAVDRYLEAHKGETFDLDIICRQMSISDAYTRDIITQKLAYEVRKGNLEKVNRTYRYIDSSYELVDWVDADESMPPLDIHWPVGADGSRFGFDGHCDIYPGDIIVVAGVSNMGKTTFDLSFLWENMDYFPCTLMGNEYERLKFKKRTMRMTWKDPVGEDGKAKFELIRRFDNWKDIIRPNNFNIIDWINLNDNFYRMGTIIEGIKQPLREGIAVVTLQKDASKSLGMGGGFSEHLASLYLSIDYNRLTVRKVKDWHDINTNGKVFGFEIINGGTQFNNIRPLIRCPDCYGYGKVKNQPCDNCYGSGWADATIQPKVVEDYTNGLF